MLRRWIIRSLFLVPLVCVVGVWVASAFGDLSACTIWRGQIWVVGALQGEAYHEHSPESGLPSESVTFDFDPHTKIEESGLSRLNCGFYWGPHRSAAGWFIVVFPLWLPTLLLLGLNWFVWRKTRQRTRHGAFPVETSAASKA